MAVALSCIRDELMPGLNAMFNSQTFVVTGWDMYGEKATETITVAGHVAPPSFPVALAMGAAAAVIANPEVTRRGLLAWVTS